LCRFRHAISLFFARNRPHLAKAGIVLEHQSNRIAFFGQLLPGLSVTEEAVVFAGQYVGMGVDHGPVWQGFVPSLFQVLTIDPDC